MMIIVLFLILIAKERILMYKVFFYSLWWISCPSTYRYKTCKPFKWAKTAFILFSSHLNFSTKMFFIVFSSTQFQAHFPKSSSFGYLALQSPSTLMNWPFSYFAFGTTFLLKTSNQLLLTW